ncbi:MAG: bifunctional folylpolyglutamate synthase/dihydrofolate synthase, partial [Chloroflexi bacterium HGW-Chloroflexi-8]
MDYFKTLVFLNSLIDYSHIPNLDFSAEKFDLLRMRDLLELMGNPQSSFPIVHMAGTKGKGSTAAMMASVLQAAGYRVGLFTSPFLFDFCEQIQVDRVWISKDELSDQVDVLKPLIEKVKAITTFEATTAIAFQYFKDRQVDIAIVEAGLGGRTDATNVVDPLMSVITSISYDHMGVLGSTIESISSHKAGIIKPGKPVVVAKQVYPEALKTLRDTADNMGSELIEAEKHVILKPLSHSLDGQDIQVTFKNRNSNDWDGQYRLNLLGAHQMDNASTALTALSKLSDSEFEINRNHIEAGLKNVNWPCRFEVVSRDPLVVLDSAHNVDSAEKLLTAMADYLDGNKIILIFGSSVDKDITGMFKVLLPKVQLVIFSKSEHPRAADPAMLVKLVRDNPVPCEVAENITEAIKSARTQADGQTAIVVAGSIFIAA